MEAASKSAKVKLTMELEINEAAMDLIKQNMTHLMNMTSQWRRQGGKGKMGEGEHGMGMMRHSP